MQLHEAVAMIPRMQYQLTVGCVCVAVVTPIAASTRAVVVTARVSCVNGVAVVRRDRFWVHTGWVVSVYDMASLSPTEQPYTEELRRIAEEGGDEEL
jgi:hypothetical protein